MASADQEAAKSPDAIKVIEEKGHLPEQVLMHIKVPYSGGKTTKDIYWKEEKWVPGFKAGKDRLTLLFCANAVRFMIRTALIHKAANPRVWKGRKKHQPPILWSLRKAWTTRTLVLHWVQWCLIPEVKKYLPTRDCLLKFFCCWTMPSGHPEHRDSTQKKVVFLAPNMMSLRESLDQRAMKTFKVHNIRSSMGRIFNAMAENLHRKSGRITPLMMPLLL